VTICAHDFEIHLDIYSEAHGEGHAAALAAALRSALAPHLFTEEDRSIAEIVLGACRERGLTLATAESCTGGMVAARLTDLPGSSDVFLGGVVAYSDTVKRQALGVLPATLATHGAVSAETAAAMAEGARVRLGADVAVAVTGVAGPGGGSDAKPVGLVHFHAVGPDGNLATSFEIPGRREWVRTRGTVAALHLVRRLLEQSRHEGG
ncbi:MAG: nicotinamide-nucleotide amidohydrolase family protein, partial [Thermoleophilia bacterium]|nr:nicotinamide-nucleotide amidohydrolase family protein [Thermoleophilia bacterium]